MNVKTDERAAIEAAVAIPPHERPLSKLMAQWQVWPLFMFRAVALQSMNPVIARGIVDHSTVWEDPASRWPRTMAYADRLHFGNDPAGTAAEIRELHRNIGGIDDDGQRYHAWNRNVWAWVHLSAMEAMFHAVRVTNPAITDRDIEPAYQRGRQVGLLYGIRDEDMPRDYPSLRRYVDEHLSENMVATRSTEQLRGFILDNLATAFSVPKPLHALVSRAVRQPLLTLLYGSFPPAARAAWGVSWSRLHELEFRGLVTMMRLATRALPNRITMKPSAYALLAKSVSSAGNTEAR